MAALATSAPMADDAELLAEDLATSERLLGLLDRLGDVLVVGVLAAPHDTVDDATAGKQHAAEDELLHGICIGTGGVEHDDAFFSTTVERDVVDAGTSACDCEEAFGESGVVHLGAANEHAIGVCELVSELVALGQAIGALLGNVV